MHRSIKLLSIAFALALGCSSNGGDGNTPVDASTTDSTADAPTTDTPASDRTSTDAIATDAPRTDAATDRPRSDAGGCPVDPSTVTGASTAGAMCTGDGMCGSLQCDTDLAGGYCWGECTESTSATCEQAQCGGRGSTCLSLGDGADAFSFCAVTCNPTARAGNPGSCRTGTVCTGWWYTHDGAEPDTTGCEYFCQSDAQCGTGLHCNSRTGECGEDPVPTTGRADGEPCDPSLDTNQCRGICFQETDDEHQGLCGSLVNLAATPNCPDNPSHIRAIAPSDDNGRTDNLGLCIYHEDCNTDSDCTAPLRCFPGVDGEASYCDYDDGSLPPPDAGTDAGPRDAVTDTAADVTPADAGTADASDAATGG